MVASRRAAAPSADAMQSGMPTPRNMLPAISNPGTQVQSSVIAPTRWR